MLCCLFKLLVAVVVLLLVLKQKQQYQSKDILKVQKLKVLIMQNSTFKNNVYYFIKLVNMNLFITLMLKLIKVVYFLSLICWSL